MASSEITLESLPSVSEIPAQDIRQRGLGRILIGRRSLRVPDEVDEEEARDERTVPRTRFGLGHGRLANEGAEGEGTCRKGTLL